MPRRPPHTALLACLLACAAALPCAAEIPNIGGITLDPAECYRVFDVNFSKGDLRVYLTAGYLIFAKPLNGIRPAAVFTSNVEAGDGEVLLLPPDRGERLSLANFTGSPNLDEHIRSAALLFTDNTAADLIAQIQSNAGKKSPEMGALLADKYGAAAANLASSFEVPLAADILNGARSPGFFYMAVSGAKLGNFDLIWNPEERDDMLAGQLVETGGRPHYNVWTAFASRGRKATAPPALTLSNFRIEATIQPDLTLRDTTRFSLTSRQPAGPAAAFAISQKMRIVSAKIDGHPAEVLQHDSLRANLLQAGENQPFLIVAPASLAAGQPHEVEIQAEGAVIEKAGHGVLYVGARGNWYPRRGPGFASYDLTFHYPREYQLVSTGDLLGDRTDGDMRTTHRRTSSPAQFVGFNLGDYESVSVARAPYKIEVYGNRQIEAGLTRPPIPQRPPPEASALTPRVRRPKTQIALESEEHLNSEQPAPAPPPNPLARLRVIAQDVAGAFDFMTAQFGPPPIKTLTVSPIPGQFGQGLSGLVYLSTLAYLNPSERPPALQSEYDRTFFSEMLDVHEVAHQWWGNLVAPAGYRDNWLTESLANYSALLYLEKKNGRRAMEAVLRDYKNHLLTKGPNGKTVESAGPITWGYRLESSQAPTAWEAITYEKGAWILHMLRLRMGDANFFAMLKEICQRYAYSSLATDDFQALVKKYGPAGAARLDTVNFFDSWVYGTGIPAIKLNYSVRGLKATGMVTASRVPSDFTARIPVEAQSGARRTLYWLMAADDGAPFSITLPGPGAKLSVAADDALITPARPDQAR